MLDGLRRTLGSDRLMNEASALHRKGNLAGAESLYLQVLQTEPDHFDALHALGFLRYQQRRFTEALSLIGAALKTNPAFPPASVNYAIVLQALNRPADALACYDKVLAIKPDVAEALFNRGNALRDYYRGLPVQDFNYNACDMALAIAPRTADILNHRGTALRDLCRPAEALASYDKALLLQPDHVEARKNRDAILRDLNRPTETPASRDQPAIVNPPIKKPANRGKIAARLMGGIVETSASFEAQTAPRPRRDPGGFQVLTAYSFGYGGPAPAAPPGPSNQAKQEMALAVARAFEPKRVIGFDKVRVGRDCDGGYVQVDDFAGVGAALSCGISDDASWDLDIAKRHIPVHQFDHTIEKSPVDHPVLTFHRQRIAAANEPGTLSLDTVAQRFLCGSGRAILKLDIEGDEWQVLSAASAETLASFSQIICEFHGLYCAAHPVWFPRFMAVLSKLRASFEVVHIHGNNTGPYANIANVILPCTFEVTFASRSIYQFAETNETFPTELDRPNLPSEPEMHLGCFKF